MAPSPMKPTATRSLAPFTLPVNREVVKAAAAPLKSSLRVFILLLLVTKLALARKGSALGVTYA